MDRYNVVACTRFVTAKPASIGVQAALKVWKPAVDLGTTGYFKDGVDGVIGKKTTAAIKEFQAANKLPVTGNANDPATLKALYSRISCKP